MDLGIKRTLSNETGKMLIPDLSLLQPGFQVQIVTSYRLTDNLDLRFLPGISFGSRIISFYNPADTGFAENVGIESSYLDFPVSLKYRTRRLNNYRPYILSGFNYRYDMATKKQDELRLKAGDVYYELGVGVDWYLPFFKLSTEMKVGVGLLDLLIKDPKSNQDYVNSIESINSYIVSFSFHFE